MEDDEFNEIDANNEAFIDAIEAAKLARDAADEALALAVERARWRGHSWSQIAVVLSVSRQAAWERYRSSTAR